MALLPGIRTLLRVLDDSWIGDAIGVACLFGGLYVWLALGHALIGGVQ